VGKLGLKLLSFILLSVLIGNGDKYFLQDLFASVDASQADIATSGLDYDRGNGQINYFQAEQLCQSLLHIFTSSALQFT
jgi:hypothetical protein